MSRADSILGATMGFGVGLLVGAWSDVASQLREPIKHEVSIPGRRRLEGDGRPPNQGGPLDVMQYLGARALPHAQLGAEQTAQGLEAARWATVDDSGQSIEQNPQPWEKYVQAFMSAMEGVQAWLQHMEGQLKAYAKLVRIRYGEVQPGHPAYEDVKRRANAYKALRQRFDMLAEGFWKYAKPVEGQQQTFGAWQAVAIVGFVVVGIAAIAWCYVAYQDAQKLKAEVELEGRELDARVESMRTGQKLPDPTTPPRDDGEFPWPLAIGGAAVALGMLGAAVADVAEGK